MKGKGYTILETMIVLAVSASIFISAVIAFGGRQQEIQFSQGVRDLDSRLQDLMNDVSTGFFNNEGNISCSVSSMLDPTAEPTPDASVSEDQGTSNDCVFIGKVLQFHPKGEGASRINIYNVVGRRSESTGRPAVSLETALPVAIGPSTLGDTELAGEVIEQSLDWGLRVTSITTTPNGTNFNVSGFGAVGFFTSFSNTLAQTVGETTISNNQSVRFGVVSGIVLGDEADDSIGADKVDATSIINSLTDRNPPTGSRTRYINLTGSDKITICLQNAEETRRAAIVIGENGSTGTTLQFDDYSEVICGS